MLNKNRQTGSKKILFLVTCLTLNLAGCDIDTLIESAGFEWQTTGTFTVSGHISLLDILGLRTESKTSHTERPTTGRFPCSARATFPKYQTR